MVLISSEPRLESFSMLYRRFPQYKKHKTWDGDAVLVLNGLKGTMYDLEGKLYALISTLFCS